MSSPYSPARVGADAGVADGLAPPPLRQRAASSAYTEGACDASSAADAAAAAAGGGAMECSIYQNYSASEVFVQGLAGMVDQQDVEAMIRAQKKMLQRFEKTNEMLSNCNTLSSTRLERARRDFKAHTVMSVTNITLSFCRKRLLNTSSFSCRSSRVLEMKKDLDSVLKRIAAVKQKIAAQNPDAFRGIPFLFNEIV